MTLRRAISGATAAVLVLLSAVTTGGVAAAEQDTQVSTNPDRPAALAAPSKEVDPATYHEFPGAEDTEYYISSQSPGRIWTDKSVFSDHVMVPADMQDPVNKVPDLLVGDDELAVALSALGSTRHVTTSRDVPIDVALILDNSYSMRRCVTGTSTSECTPWQNSRAKAMVDAVNSAIDIIGNENPENRVSITIFGNTAEEIIGLTKPADFGDTGTYLTLAAPTAGPNSRPMTLTVAGKTREVGSQIGNNSGTIQYTNIQRGITTGMATLTDSAPEMVTGVDQRSPNVILFTDGDPTRSASDDAWWNPGTDNTLGSGDNPFYGNGFKAALAASVLKKQIADHYNDREYNSNLGLEDIEARVYTVALGLPALASDSRRDLARATLDPRANLGATGNATNREFNAYLDTYLIPGNPNVVVSTGNATHTLRHPNAESGFMAYDVMTYEDFRYNTAFYDPYDPAELKEKFDEIANAIVNAAPNYPVEVSESTSTDGFVTFEDRLGKYMHVTDFNRLAFCSVLAVDDPAEDPADDPAAGPNPNVCKNETFTEPKRTSEGLTDTYEFTGNYTANSLETSTANTEVKSIKVTVTRGATLAQGDLVTVKIPAAMLPIYDKQVKLDADGNPTITPYASHPVHAYYKVAPKAKVLGFLGDSTTALAKDERDALVDYIGDNTDADGKVRFYSNAFEADSTAGSTKAKFNPAKRNDFYRFSVDTPLFLEAESAPLAFSAWAGIEDSAALYYEDVVYIDEGGGPAAVPLKVDTTAGALRAAAAGSVVVKEGPAGQAVAPAGMRDYGPRPLNLDHGKCDPEFFTWNEGSPVPCADIHLKNTTATASMARLTQNNRDEVVVSLGNNGYLAYDAPGTLTVQKTVPLTEFEPARDTEFAFRLDVDGAEGRTFLADIYASDGTFYEERSVVVGDATSDPTFKLTAGQYVVIYGLPNGANYTVTELDPLPSGYTLEGGYERTGVINVAAQEAPPIEFVNTYTAAEVPVAGPEVAKILERREWTEDDAFTFTMTGPSGPYTVTLDRDDLDAADPESSDTARGMFPAITFDTPGTYIYTITEVDENSTRPSISYSAASYQWVVTVDDDGVGKLFANAVLTKIKDDSGTGVAPAVEMNDEPAVFRNFYDVDQVSGTLQATKMVVDNTRPGGEVEHNPTLAHQFTYKYLGVGPDDELPAEFDDERFPLSHLLNETDSARVSNVPGSPDVDSPALIFTRAHVGHKFYYSVEEDAPSPGSFVEPDGRVYIYEITVDLDMSAPISDGPDGGVKYPVAAQSVRCQTTKAEVAANGPFGTCAPGVGVFGTGIPAIFINLYSANAGLVDLVATKELQGRAWLPGDEFIFVIDGEDAPTQDASAEGTVTVITGTNEEASLPATVSAKTEGEGNVVFNVKFTEQGTYRFRITEVSGAAGGMDYATDSAVYTVTVTNPESDVETDLVATWERVDGDGVFTNIYSAAETSGTPTFVKTLTGRNWLAGDAFTFVIEGVGDSPMPDITEATVTFANAIGGDAGFDFGAIRFTAAGTYQYVVSERATEIPATTSDTSKVTVTITVEDDHAGALYVASMSYESNDPVDTNSQQFVNTYSKSLPGGFDLEKTFNRAMGEGDFTFSVDPDLLAAERFGDDYSTVSSPDGEAGEAARIPGPRFTFTHEDADKRYCWTISENHADPMPGVVYDEATYVVCVVVADDPTADVLEAEVTITKSGVPDGEWSETFVISSGDEGLMDELPVLAFSNEFVPSSWTLEKGSDPDDGHVGRGELITYTLTATNTGDEGAAPPTNIVITDDLTGVLGESKARFVEIDKPHSGTAEFDPDSGTLIWELDTLDTEETLTYTVLVDEQAYGVVLRNAVSGMGGVDREGDGEGDLPPETCAAGVENAESGEVEEKCETTHVTDPTWTLTKSSDDTDGHVEPGDTIEYTLTATTIGDERTAVAGVVITDHLADVLEHAQLNPDSFKSSAGEVDWSAGQDLVWRIDELDGVATLSYTVTVDPDAYGVTLRNVVTGMGGLDPESPGDEGDLPPATCVEDSVLDELGEGCATEHATDPIWTLVKSSTDADGTVRPGDTITYTLTATSEGEDDSTVSGVVITDDLTDVVGTGRSEFVEIVGNHAGTAAFDPISGMLTWNLGTLDGVETLRYTVQVADSAHGVRLRNVVTGTGDIDPEECVAETDVEELDGACTTVHATNPIWTMSKTSAQRADAPLDPGATIEYTLTVTNPSEDVAVTDVVVTDDLSGVVGVATLVTPLPQPVPDVGTVSVSEDGNALLWSIEVLGAGETVEFTYSVKINENAKAYGATLHNEAWGTGKGLDMDDDGDPDVVPPTQCTEDEPCSTDHTVATPTWTIAKSSDSVAVPGGSITYQLTVSNTSEFPLWGATISDGPVGHGEGVTDIWDFLDDDGWNGEYTVQIGTDGEVADRKDPNPANGLQHVIDELGVDEQAIVTFTVDLPEQFDGDGVHLRNTVTGSLIPDPADGGEPDGPSFPPETCAIPNGEAPCSVDHVYPPRTDWTMSKTADTPRGATVQPGDTITYTLTAENRDAENDVTDVVITDDLSRLLVDGVVTLDEPLGEPSKGGVSRDDTTLTWDVGTLAAGETVTFTYSVTVVESATAYGTTLHNAAWGTGSGVTEDGPDTVLPPAQCTEAEPCSTDHKVPVPAWTLAKSSDTDTAVPGGDITYELTVTNTGSVPLYGVQVVDGPQDQAKGVTDIWSVLAGDGWQGEYTVRIGEGDPVVHTDTDPSDGLQAELAPVPVGSTATVTFTVTLPAKLDTVHLRNTVTGALPGDPDGPGYAPVGCSEPGPDDACSADHEYVAPRVAAPKVSSGGSLAATGATLAALAGAAALLMTAAALLVRRRREEPAD